MKMTGMAWLAAVLALFGFMLAASCDDDDDDDNNDDAAVDDDAIDDDAVDDDSGDDDTLDDDTTDDDTLDDDTTDDDTLDDDTTDDDTTDDDTTDDDTADDDTADDDAPEISIKTYNHAAVLPYLNEFAARGFRLYLGAGIGDVGSANLAAILTQTEALGVPVTICPYVSEGGFPSEENIDLFEEEAHALVDWIETVSSAVDTISVNMELGHPLDQQIQQAWNDRDFALLWTLLEGTMDRERFVGSVKRYAQIVSDFQDLGYEMQITTYPFMLDDLVDGDTDIQDSCNIPMSGIGWDRIAPCAYSTEYAHMVGLFEASAYFVTTYAQSALELYGDAAVVDVGLVRHNGLPGYATPAELSADVAAAKAVGVRRIEVFYFSGFLQYSEYTFADWADAIDVEPAVPATDPIIDLVRFGARVVDFIMNFME
ncbi:MAG TPA: hypothetical protein PKW95_06750 [bacterium]|nr:hypothetical protein [bacterium]